MVFQATFLNSSNVKQITSSCTEIAMVDNSNYQQLSDTATAGGASTITLASGSSTVNDFYNTLQIEILSGTGVGQKRTISDYVGSTLVATVSVAWDVVPDSTSVYEIAEAGHLQSDFSSFKKILIDQPDNTSYLFSSIGDGDATLNTPDGETLPITTSYTYATGDGVYTVTLYVLPTWNAATTYLFRNQAHVYNAADGLFYKILQDGTNQQPDSAPTYWEAVTLANLSLKYLSANTFAIYCCLCQCNAELTNTFVNNQVSNGSGTHKMCIDDAWVDSNKLGMILDSIDGSVNNLDWTSVTALINKGKTICDCNDI